MTETHFPLLVTGAGRGIGQAIAERLLQAGYQVIIGYLHSREGALALAKQYPENSLAIPFDVTDRQAVKQALQTATNHFRTPVLGLVNNAGIAQPVDFLELTDQDWDRMLAVNLKSNFILAQEMIPPMLKTGFGRIIHISSVGAQTGGIYQPHYAAAKAGQINLARSLSRLYAGKGITANAIAIGLVETELSRNELARPEAAKRVAAIPAGRLGTPQDVAALVEFLVSYQAGYVTGQCINLDGGGG